MRYLFVILAILSLGFRPIQLTYPEGEKTEWVVGKVWLEDMGDCKYRCQKVIERSSEDFFLVHGTHKGTPHRWIETIDGKLLDPSFPDINRSDYTETSREYVKDNKIQCVIERISEDERSEYEKLKKEA